VEYIQQKQSAEKSAKENLKETADGFWQLLFSFYVLGTLDLRKNKIARN